MEECSYCEPYERNFIIILDEMFLILVLLEDEQSFWSLRRHVGILGFWVFEDYWSCWRKVLKFGKIGEEILWLILVLFKKGSCFGPSGRSFIIVVFKSGLFGRKNFILVSLKTSSYFGLREDKFVFGEKSYILVTLELWSCLGHRVLRSSSSSSIFDL